MNSDPAGFLRERNSSNINGLLDSIKEWVFGKKRERDPSKDIHATEAELIDNVFFFNAMGEDEANGVFTLVGDQDDDELALDWPADKPIGDQQCFSKVEEMMQKLSAAMGAQYTPLPTWDGSLSIGRPTRPSAISSVSAKSKR